MTDILFEIFCTHFWACWWLVFISIAGSFIKKLP